MKHWVELMDCTRCVITSTYDKGLNAFIYRVESTNEIIDESKIFIFLAEIRTK